MPKNFPLTAVIVVRLVIYFRHGKGETLSLILIIRFRLKTDNHNIVSRKNLDGTDGKKVVSNSKLNRETGTHFPTPPPMPEHKLQLLLTDLKNAGLLAAPKGSYSLISPDGVKLNVNWDADENKFQATGDHFPTPPPMPEHKLKYEMNPIDGDRSVVEKKDDGSYSFR